MMQTAAETPPDDKKEASPLGWVVGVFTALAAGAYITEPLAHQQVYKLVVLAQYLAAHEALPPFDIWTQAGQLAPLSAPPPPAVILTGKLFLLGGWRALVLVKLFLCCLFAVSTALLYSRLSGSYFWGATVAIVVSCAALMVVPLDGTLLAASLSPAILLLLIEPRPRPWQYLTLAGLIVAMAQGALLGWAVPISLVAISRWTLQEEPGRRNVAAIAIALFAGLSAGFSLIGRSLHYFGLWLQTAFLVDPNPATVFDYSSGVLFLLLALAIALGTRSALPRAVRRTAMLAALTTVAALASKQLILYAAPAVGLFLAAAWPQRERSLPIVIAIERVANALAKLPAAGTVWLLACIVFVNSTNLWRLPIVEGALPTVEADALLANPDLTPIWNPADVGDYLAFRLNPDSAKPIRKVWANSDSLLAFPEELRAEQQQLFASSLAAVQPRAVLARTRSPVAEALMRDPGWKRASLFQTPPTDKPLALAWSLFIPSDHPDVFVPLKETHNHQRTAD